MARVTGFGTGFNDATFRTAIKNVMKMGAPNKTEEKVTFLWTPVKTFDKGDFKNKAWNLNAAPTNVDNPDPVLIDCAVEFQTRNSIGSGNALGDWDIPRAVITVLDEDYLLIFNDGRRADKVTLGGDTYKIDFVAPPMGLFAVTVYQIHVSAIDEV